ncbi:MAG TPA: pitrilysin family protein [Terriglobales bacterium]|nr:pitrilysin family protein [Terriglobales bacterium]
MMRPTWLTSVILLLCAAALIAQYKPSSKHIKPQKLHVFPTDLATVASDSPLYQIQIMVRTGSADDPAGQEGTANLAARALIEGGFGNAKQPVTTQKLAEITRPWGDAAFPTVLVDKQATTFSMTVPRNAFAPYVARVLKPMFNQPLWLPKEMDRLRRDALTGIQSGLRFEDQESLGLLALDNYIFSGSSLGHLAAGTVKGLQAITPADLGAFYKRYYTVGNMYVATTINNQQDLSKLVAALPPGEPVYRPANLHRSVVAPGRHVLIITQPNAIATGLHLGYPIFLKRTDSDYWPLFVANVFFGVHRDSFGRLYQELREERGYNYGDYSYIEYQYGRPQFLFPPPTTPREQQYFSIWIRPVGHQYAHFIMKAMTAELARFARQGMTPKQVAGAKIKARALYLNYAESVSRQLGYRLDDMFYGMRDQGYLEQMLASIDAVTPQQVNAAIQKYLQSQNLDYVIVTSEAQGEKLANDIAGDSNVRPKTPEEYHIAQPVPPGKQKMLEQDKEWGAYPLEITMANITVVKAADMFETAAVPGTRGVR